MDEAVIFSCINETCGRPFPREVSYCPYCGTGQVAQKPPRRVSRRGSEASDPPAVVVPPVARVEVQPVEFDTNTPQVTEATTVKPPAPTADADARAVETPPTPPVNEKLAKPAGKKWKWIGGAALIAGSVWWFGSEDEKARLEVQVNTAIATARDCKIDEAQAQLGELQNGNATIAQMQSVKQALDRYRPDCAKQQQRTKAWGETRAAVEAAIGAGTFDRAETRLAAFVRRWGEDADTRDLRETVVAGNAVRLLNESQACLDNGNVICVQQRLSVLEKKEHPELADRILALKEALAAQQTKPVAQPEPPAVPTLPAVVAPMPSPAPASAANANAVYIDSLLRDGETALAGKRYREAMTNANNVLRLDPANRPARNLLERARSAEFKALQEETVVR